MKMKQIVFVIQTIIYSFLCSIYCHGQIEYGSNNGQYISINNSRIYYEEYGEGTYLLLLHGGIGSINDFKFIIPELSKHFRVIAIDSPGHGRSEQADSLSYQLMADYISQMIDLIDLDSIYIIGQSDGGNIALLLAHDRPGKVKRIVISGANSNVIGLTEHGFNLLNSVDSQLIEDQFQDWLINYKNISPQKDNWKKFIHDIRDMWIREVVISDTELGKIESRTLVVMGDRDDLVKLDQGFQLYSKIGGSEFCVLPNTPHNPFKFNPDLINFISINFLTSK